VQSASALISLSTDVGSQAPFSNPVTTSIPPQFIPVGGSLNATLSFFGENEVVGCDLDEFGSCHNGPLEPPFIVEGEGTGTLDVNYTLPAWHCPSRIIFL
jgi:hypothetical protein